MKLFGKLPELIFSLILAVVIIQLAIGAIQPYLSWIGRTFAIMVIVLLVAVAVVGVVAAIRYLHTKLRNSGTFNGE